MRSSENGLSRLTYTNPPTSSPKPFSNRYVFTIVSYLIGVFIFATIVGQVGNVITNRNANRLEFERLLDGAKTYMRHHKVHICLDVWFQGVNSELFGFISAHF